MATLSLQYVVEGSRIGDYLNLHGFEDAECAVCFRCCGKELESETR